MRLRKQLSLSNTWRPPKPRTCAMACPGLLDAYPRDGTNRQLDGKYYAVREYPCGPSGRQLGRRCFLLIRAQGRRLRRGEIRWYTFRLPDKRRPVLLRTRNEVIDRLNQIIVVPATRTIRGLTTEVILTTDDGMPAMCALNFDHVALAQRNRIGP